jgi:hypothetical protein
MQAFDPGSGEPRQCVEMASWPRMERMTETFGATVGRALLESFYASATTEGLSVIFNRCAAQALDALCPNRRALFWAEGHCSGQKGTVLAPPLCSSACCY